MTILAYYQLLDPYYQGIAAQLSFYLFLSLVPTFILLSQFLGLFSLSLSSLESWVGANVKGESANTLMNMLNYSPSGVNSIFLAVTALWAASRTQFAMIRVTNYILTDGATTGEGYLKDRIRALKTALVTIFTMVFALVVIVYGPMIVNIAVSTVLGKDAADLAWMALRWPLTAALYFFMVSYNYYVLPTKKMKFREIMPGSIFSSLGFMAVTYFFNLYTENSTNYDILYGSFSNIVALLFWLMFMSWVLFLGVMVNRVWIATRTTKPVPMNLYQPEKRKPINKV